MSKRELYKTFLTAVVISSMLGFASCTHQEKGDEAGSDASTEDVAASDAGAADAADKGEDKAATEGGDDLNKVAEESAPAEQKPAEQAAAPTDAEKPEEAKADELTSLENQAAAEQPAAPTEAPPADPAAGAAVADATPPPTEATAPPVDPAPPTTPPVADAAPAPTEPPVTDPTPAPEVEKPARKVHHAASGSNRVPKIPANAKKVKGALLNRFYFVRQGDTPQSVAELLYGTPARAKDLVKWNGPGWKPGRLLFYGSTQQPTDGQMRSFYQEHGVQPEDYVVGKGDWLSKIAQKKLGNSGSWKEIAVINGFSKANDLEVGKRIAIYPRDLRAGGEGTKMAQNEPTAKESATASQPPVAAEPPPQPTPPPPVEEPVKKPAPKTAGAMNIQKMIEQNIFAVAMGALIFLLVVALLALNKRKRARLDDLSEDGFSPPTKLKRK